MELEGREGTQQTSSHLFDFLELTRHCLRVSSMPAHHSDKSADILQTKFASHGPRLNGGSYNCQSIASGVASSTQEEKAQTSRSGQHRVGTPRRCIQLLRGRLLQWGKRRAHGMFFSRAPMNVEKEN